jgi:hypothetical protein
VAISVLLHLGWRIARRLQARPRPAGHSTPGSGDQVGANWCDMARDVLADDQKLNRLTPFLDYGQVKPKGAECAQVTCSRGVTPPGIACRCGLFPAGCYRADRAARCQRIVLDR